MNSNSNKILGVVLCGGQSSRMGRDKGLLSVNGQAWFEKIFHLLSIFFSEVIVSVNPTQISVYQERKPAIQFIQDSYSMTEGPLAGILTLHRKYPGSDLFIVACDMITVEESVISTLLDAFESNSIYDFYLYQNSDYLETLCGIYTARGLEKLDQIILGNPEIKPSIHRLIQRLNPFIIPIKKKDQNFFTNFNTLEDLKILPASISD